MENNEGYANCRFYVEIHQITHAVFTEMGPLDIQTQVEDYAEGGNNSFIHKLPGHTRIGNVVLKFGLTNSMQLFQWYLKIIQGKIDRRNVTVRVFAPDKKQITSWSFVNAFPVRWSGPQLLADGMAVAIETLELAHEGLVLS
ncbi:MAG TPA: phage tail protein [Chthonomonadaceae bacterium]|nr:phage tail protein [Chthonomonadaceae bacterium]